MLTERHKVKLFDSGPLTYFFFQMAFGTALTYLTSGVFLSGLAILMGTGDVLANYLSVIVDICGVLILLFSASLERFQNQKRLTLALTALFKLTILFIVMIPALLPERLQLVIFIPAVVTAFTLQAQTTVVLSRWMLKFMDEKKSGHYISLRQTTTLFVIVVLSPTIGRLMDYMNEEYTGFMILLAFAAMIGAIELVLLVRTPDNAVGQTVEQSCRFGDIVKLPLENREFASFVFYILLFYLLLYISDSFTMVYLMKYLVLPHQTVSILYMIISLPQIILFGIQGRVNDRRGHRFVLTPSIWLFAGETLFILFASPKTWFLLTPIASLIPSVANVDSVIAVLSRWYELMPEGNRIVYGSFYTVAIGLGLILGPMIDGAIEYLLEESAFLASAISSVDIRLLYPILTVGILLLQIIYLFSQRNRKESTYVNHRFTYSFQLQ